MSKALRWIRSSQGSDDDIGLDVQRDRTAAVADEIADDVDTLDLGIHTGFSSFSRGTEVENRIDAHPDVLRVVDELRDGEYDYIVAWDDTRVARDDFFFVVQHAAIQGGADFVFAEDIDLSGLTFRVKRVVEQQVKVEEIRKSKAARKERRARGGYEGRAPIGTTLDEDGIGLIADDDFHAIQKALRMKDDGASHRDVVAEIDVIGSPSTVSKILDRRDLYDEIEKNGCWYPDVEPVP